MPLPTRISRCLLAFPLLLAGSAFAQSAPMLSVKLDGISSGQPLDAKYAYCAPDGKGGVQDGGNISPEISWSGAPGATRSFAILVVDKDVPASFELANKAGKTIPDNFPRQDFYHWVLTDIPASLNSLAEGKDSHGITPGGKKPGAVGYGVDGQNSYPMAGKGRNIENSGGGYDGPCPPWNDARLHHYHFMVYALDVPSLGLSGSFTGKQAEAAIKGHVLAEGEAVGIFSNNSKLLTK